MKTIYTLFLVLFVLFGCIGTPAEQAEEEFEEETEEQEPVVANVTAEEEDDEEETADEPEEIDVEAEEPDEEEEEEAEELEGEDFVFTTTDQWDIHATFYYAQFDKPDTAIILIHKYGSDRSRFDSLVSRLHSDVPDADVITYDIRGHGESNNLGDYDNFQAGDFRGMRKDIGPIKEYIDVHRSSVENYYLVGESIGSSVALNYAAEEGGVDKVIMISPGTSYHDLDVTENAEDYIHALYIAAGSEDHYSHTSASEIYGLSTSDSKELEVYYGYSEHGLDLIDATADDDEPLEDLIVEWLKR